MGQPLVAESCLTAGSIDVDRDVAIKHWVVMMAPGDQGAHRSPSTRNPEA